MKNSAIVKQSPYVIATFFAMALHSLPVRADDLPELQMAGNIPFVTGGIGDEERSALRASQHDYNLRVLSAGVDGAYPGDTHIIITDNHGHELINADADPLFYAKMPTGHYIVQESSNDQTKKQAVVISSNKPVNMIFRWK